MNNTEAIIKKIILEMDIPFKISDLFWELSQKGITDKALILDVLNSLLNSGLVKHSDVQDDVNLYCSAI